MCERFILDDLVGGSNPPPTPEHVREALAFVEKICGPLHMTCLRHGPECEMRRVFCVISSRQVQRSQ